MRRLHAGNRENPAGMLLLFFFAAALATFGTVRACQVNGLASVAIWQQPGP